MRNRRLLPSAGASSAFGLAALILFVVSGCAAKAPVMPPAPVAPKYPEFRYPTVPQAADAAQATRIERGWRLLQADNLRAAEREFESALKLQPAFHPAQTGMGYLELARNDANQAVAQLRSRARQRSVVRARARRARPGAAGAQT